MSQNDNERLIRAGSGPGEVYFLLSQMEKTMVALTVTDGLNAWIGNAAENMLKQASKKIRMEYEDYMKDTKRAFSGDKDFHFEFEKQDNKLKVTWKKHLATDDLKINFGIAMLKQHAAPSTVICDMFMSSITAVETKEQKIIKLNNEVDKLEKDLKKSNELVKNFADVKEDTEKDLYSKFVLVLNEKKAKIRELEDELGTGTRKNHGKDLGKATVAARTEPEPDHVPSSSSSVSRKRVESQKPESPNDSDATDPDSDFDILAGEEIRKPAPKKKRKMALDDIDDFLTGDWDI